MNTANIAIKCKFCPSIFESKNSYLEHIEAKHQAKPKTSFMCSDCGKQYKTKTELTHHIRSKCGTLKQFKCKICEQELMSAGSLYNHMLRHNGTRSFMCRFCAKLFFTAGQLKVHERIHTKDKAYVCEVCNKGFCHRQSLITHSTLHTGIKPYQCESCGSSFSCVGNLIKHRKTHADSCGLIPLTTHRVINPSTKIKVRINTPASSKLKTLEKREELQREVITLKTELFCDESEKITEETNNLKGLQNVSKEKHKSSNCINDEESDNSNNYDEVLNDFSEGVSAVNDPSNVESYDHFIKLEPNVEVSEEYDDKLDNGTESDKEVEGDVECGSRKAKKKRRKYKVDPDFDEELKRFIEDWNLGTAEVAVCKFCNKAYSNVRWFYKHVKDHKINASQIENQVKLTLHKCSCCKESFLTKTECLEHQQNVHADVLSCQDCDKIFANRDSLRSHLNIFHKGVSRKTYTYICEKCGQQFKQKSTLLFHEERNCDKGPLYECSTCKKQFSSKHTRNNHTRIHDSEKKLLCKFCAKSFHWKGQLKIHERSHTGEKPFACLYCPKAFAYRESLMTHSTIHTGIKPHLCDACGSRFSCIGNLIKHKSSHATECGPWSYKNHKNRVEIGVDS